MSKLFYYCLNYLRELKIKLDIGRHDVLRAILINFIPVFLGVLCAYILTVINEEREKEKFIESCIHTIYKDNRETIKILVDLTEGNYKLRDTTLYYINDTLITMADILEKIGIEYQVFKFVGYKTLIQSNVKLSIEYELLSKFEILDRYVENYNDDMERRYSYLLDNNSFLANDTQTKEHFTLYTYAVIQDLSRLLNLVVDLILYMEDKYEYDFLHPDREYANETNIALNKPVKYSSIEPINKYLPQQPLPEYINDGKKSWEYRWSSEFSDPQWIQIDLEAMFDIDAIVIRWESAAKEYDVLVSDDEVNWTKVHSGSANPCDIEVLELQTKGRFLKIFGKQRATPYGYSIIELEVYGDEL